LLLFTTEYPFRQYVALPEGLFQKIALFFVNVNSRDAVNLINVKF
jgi:hypothetical protein